MRSWLWVFCFLLVFALPVYGAEYFVNKAGRDENPGTSPDLAFLTIQRGVDVLTAGDTLTVGPGEYEEKVARKGLGEAGRKTIIRAEIPGTVVLRGDVNAPIFSPVEGLSRTYVVDFTRDVQAVNEVDTLTLLEPVPNAEELPFRPGSYYYDAAGKRLYISTSDLRPVEHHAYTVSVIGDNGFFLDGPVGVEVDGLAVSGFNTSREAAYSPGGYTVWGILLFNPADCVIRNCITYLNGGGIIVNSKEQNSRRNVIEYCTSYGNFSAFGAFDANILIYSPKDGVIRHCLAYRCREAGLLLYGQGMLGENAIEDSVAWGNRMDLFIKGGGAMGTLRRSVALGGMQVFVKDMQNVFAGGQNPYRGDDEWPRDSIHLDQNTPDPNLDFADPENLDFRLQETSRFRGAGPDNTDAGPFPFQRDVFFVKPDGNDEASGLSVKDAWRTLGRATGLLKPGDTLYLESGSYPGNLDLKIQGDKPVFIRGRGRGDVLINGNIEITGARNIHFERIRFAQPVKVNGGRDIRFSHCHFSGIPINLILRKTDASRVEQCEFSGFTESGIQVDESPNFYSVGNSFQNQAGSAIALKDPKTEERALIAYSDYNAYTTPDAVIVQNGSPVSLKEWQALGGGHDAHSFSTASSQGMARIGALGKPVGPHPTTLAETVAMSRPQVHSVSTTTANLEWLVSEKLICDLAWGETPACEKSTQYEADRYGSFSLTGLKPATTYYFQIRRLSYPWSQGGRPRPASAIEPQFDVISFTTAAQPAEPKTYYVAPDGSNANDGLSRATAWRTVAYAAGEANVGDMVWVAGGSYPERVRVRATGEKNAPISFRSLPGERVEFTSAGKLLESSWVINGKSHVKVDGFYFGQFRMAAGNKTGPRVFCLYDSSDIEISRCLYNARGRGYGAGFLTVRGGHDVTVSNCVMIGGFNSIGVSGCSNFRLEHSVVVVPMIQASLVDAAGRPLVMESNIFTDSSPGKVKVCLHEWGGQNEILDRNNVYFLRVPDAEREHYWILNFRENGKDFGHTRMGLEDYRRRVMKTDSIIGDPQFAGLVNQKIKSGYAADGFLELSKKEWDFPDFYATNPEVLNRGIGLQTERFEDFHFQKKK